MHFDSTVSLGNVISAAAFTILALFAWRDLTWRIRNLEDWRKTHMIDADARDALLAKMDRIIDHLRWQTEYMLGKRGESPPTGTSKGD